MKTVNLNVSSTAKASRLELFVRIVWAIVSMVVLWVLGIIAGICLVLQWLVILITGTRNMELNKVIQMYFAYSVKMTAYMFLLTDERNPLLPED